MDPLFTFNLDDCCVGKKFQGLTNRMDDLEESEAMCEFLSLLCKERAVVDDVESRYSKMFRNQSTSCSHVVKSGWSKVNKES